MCRQKFRIVSLGGATGHAQVLEGLAPEEDYQITVFCTVSDEGGDTGRTVKEFKKVYGVNGALGDVSKCTAALSPVPGLSSEWGFRFNSGSRYGQSVKNTLYLGLILQYGPERALQLLWERAQLKPHHRVYPVSYDKAVLEFRLASGQKISGESYLDMIAKNKLWDPKIHRIVDVWLKPKVKALKVLLEAIAEADVILIPAGDLFSSIIPALLVEGVAKAIAKSKAHSVQVVNIMTKLGETDGYNAADFVREVHKRIGRKPDAVLCNSNGIPKNLLKRYRTKEHKVKVVADTLQNSEYADTLLFREDLWDKTPEGYIVHNPQKTATALKKIFAQLRDNSAVSAA